MAACLLTSRATPAPRRRSSRNSSSTARRPRAIAPSASCSPAASTREEVDARHRSARASSRRDGSVVLELHLGEAARGRSLRAHNVAAADLTARTPAHEQEVSHERVDPDCARRGDGAGHRLDRDAVRPHARRRGRALAARPAPARRRRRRAAGAGRQRGAARERRAGAGRRSARRQRRRATATPSRRHRGCRGSPTERGAAASRRATC